MIREFAILAICAAVITYAVGWWLYGEQPYCVLHTPTSTPSCYHGEVPENIKKLTRIRVW